MFGYGMKIDEDANKTKQNVEKTLCGVHTQQYRIGFHFDKYVHFSTTNHVHSLNIVYVSSIKHSLNYSRLRFSSFPCSSSSSFKCFV